MKTQFSAAARAAMGSEPTSDAYRHAFEQLTPELERIAYAYALDRLHGRHLAEDATQGALLTAWRVLPQLRDPEALSSWFRRVVWTQCSLLRRKRTPQLVAMDEVLNAPATGPDPHEAAERRELRDRVLRAVDRLPEHEGVAVSMFYIEGRSQKQVADALSITPTAVSTRLHSARRRLRERMAAVPSTPASAAAIEYGVSHARVFVSDFARAREFYVDTLGMSPAHEDGESWMLFDTGGADLLVETGPPASVGRIAGISLTVPDIEAAYDTLTARGVDFTGPPQRQFWGGVRTDFHDPDGNQLTLVGWDTDST
jgi:RNA polymerase sigma factor (sigma-70 family)